MFALKRGLRRHLRNRFRATCLLFLCGNRKSPRRKRSRSGSALLDNTHDARDLRNATRSAFPGAAHY